MLNGRSLVGAADVLFLTLDTLRYDVAVEQFRAGRTPNLASRFDTWEKRHAPANFTFASHQAMFAGFLPTKAVPGPHPRLFALAFEGSETTTDETAVFDAPNIIAGFADAGYHTACVGGTGFFNKRNPLGRVLPEMFRESHWSAALGVTDPNSPTNQIDCGLAIIEQRSSMIGGGAHESGNSLGPPLFLFINVSAMHQPNCIFADDASSDSPATQGAALAAVDRELGRLFDALGRSRPCLCIVTSDHGTAYGEDGYHGHRLGHDVVWTVPYADFVIEKR